MSKGLLVVATCCKRASQLDAERSDGCRCLLVAQSAANCLSARPRLFASDSDINRQRKYLDLTSNVVCRMSWLAITVDGKPMLLITYRLNVHVGLVLACVRLEALDRLKQSRVGVVKVRH